MIGGPSSHYWQFRFMKCMNKFRKLLLVLAAGAVTLSLGACEKKGPLEKAGEKIDKAGEKAGDKIKDATK